MLLTDFMLLLNNNNDDNNQFSHSDFQNNISDLNSYLTLSYIGTPSTKLDKHIAGLL